MRFESGMGILIAVTAFLAAALAAYFFHLKKKKIIRFLEGNGYQRLAQLRKEEAEVIEALLGDGCFGMIMASDGEKSRSWIFEFRGENEDAPLNTHILCSVPGYDFMTLAGYRQNFDVTKYLKDGSALAKMVNFSRPRTGGLKSLKLISHEEQLNIHIPRFLIMKAGEGRLFEMLSPDRLHILREWAENDMAEFLFYRNYYLIRIGADASLRESLKNFFMFGQKNIDRWRNHLEMNALLMKSMGGQR